MLLKGVTLGEVTAYHENWTLSRVSKCIRDHQGYVLHFHIAMKLKHFGNYSNSRAKTPISKNLVVERPGGLAALREIPNVKSK